MAVIDIPVTHESLGEKTELPSYAALPTYTQQEPPRTDPPAFPSSNPAPWVRTVESLAIRLAAPLSRWASKHGCEPFAPLPADEECRKAARILKSLASESDPSPAPHPPHPVSIHPSVLSQAAGLVIFSTGRVGFGSRSASLGSGVLLARDGQNAWSAPVPIKTFSFGAGPVAAGAEATSRVYVLQSREAVELFGRARFMLGPEAVLALGPHGGGAGVNFAGMVKKDGGGGEGDCEGCRSRRCRGREARDCGETDERRDGGAFPRLRKRLARPTYCYMRSRGFYAGLQAEGSVFMRRQGEKASEEAVAALMQALREAEQGGLDKDETSEQTVGEKSHDLY